MVNCPVVNCPVVNGPVVNCPVVKEEEEEEEEEKEKTEKEKETGFGHFWSRMMKADNKEKIRYITKSKMWHETAWL